MVEMKINVWRKEFLSLVLGLEKKFFFWVAVCVGEKNSKSVCVGSLFFFLGF
jgi:hypothetical protein